MNHHSTPLGLLNVDPTLGPKYFSSIRDKRLDEVTTNDILAILKPIWTQKAEIASRLRGRLEQFLDATRVKGLRTGETPAPRKGASRPLLHRRQKLQPGYHAALPYGEIPPFMARLREREAVAASALEFAILTVSRPSEVRGATWIGIDLEASVWVIPAGRKEWHGNIGHRSVMWHSLSSRMADLRAEEEKDATYIFPGQRPKHPLGNMTMSILVRDMKPKAKVTVHGFRSSFQDWGGQKVERPFRRIDRDQHVS